MRVTYKLRPGFVLKVPIETVGAHIEALKKRNATKENPKGGISDEALIADGKNPRSPIHACFTWDESKAAHKQRLSEAQYLTRCYEVHIERPRADPIIISPANVRIMKDGQSLAVGPDFAMSEEEHSAQVLRDTVRMLGGLQERLKKLQGITPAAIKLINKLREVLEREIEVRQQKEAG